MENTCATCQGKTQGYKCATCGEVSETHDPSHEHGAALHQPKCVGCDEAETKCICPPASRPSS